MYSVWPQRGGLGSNFNSIQGLTFSRSKQRKAGHGKGHLVWSGFSMATGALADVYMSAMLRQHWGACWHAATASVGPEWSLISSAFLTSFQVMLTQWPYRSFPSLRNVCMFSPTQTPFPLTPRCDPVATSCKERPLGHFLYVANVPYKWHVVTFPPQSNRGD